MRNTVDGKLVGNSKPHQVAIVRASKGRGTKRRIKTIPLNERAFR